MPVALSAPADHNHVHTPRQHPLLPPSVSLHLEQMRAQAAARGSPDGTGDSRGVQDVVKRVRGGGDVPQGGQRMTDSVLAPWQVLSGAKLLQGTGGIAVWHA